VLALMDHMRIARVFDGGTTESGRPYFVMELVKGRPITDYCDQNCLTPRQRPGLFRDVCAAVQHAHQKGVIHRGLKPSNILVTVHDMTLVVKVIDFGIAKATGAQLTEQTHYSQFAQMVGTPLYMSPEQAGHSGPDVATRSDVYSLGVLLYELLTGTTPFASEGLKKAGFQELRRIIREEEPDRTNARLSTLAVAELPTVAERRGADPKKLSQAVRGGLDWIVMKCLEKNRNRRYESTSALAADVHHYLNDKLGPCSNTPRPKPCSPTPSSPQLPAASGRLPSALPAPLLLPPGVARPGVGGPPGQAQYPGAEDRRADRRPGRPAPQARPALRRRRPVGRRGRPSGVAAARLAPTSSKC
jgi:serine/threonine protein kinase